MFGKILEFDNNKIIVENTQGISDSNYIGIHVVFEYGPQKIVGEIVGIDTKTITIFLIGEIVGSGFSSGVLKKPSINSKIRIIYKNELAFLLGDQDYTSKENLLIGKSPIYQNHFVTTRLNSFLTNHFAIMGNSGHGKSCGLARLLQNIFFTTNEAYPKNAHICLFDVYGEYVNTFDEMNNFVGLHFKKVTTEIKFKSENMLRIPAYLLDIDDLAILLEVTSPTQLPVLAETLKLVKIFKSEDPRAIDYKNDIIARCLLDILASGKNSNQLRDQVISVLTAYNTDTLNLNSIIKEPGYSRTIKQCLNIDDQGKINAINIVVEFLRGFVTSDIESIPLSDNIPYDLGDLYYALEFALINEGVYTSTSSFELTNTLKSRLKSLINSEKNNFFTYEKYMSKNDYVENFFKDNFTNETAQLVDVDLSFLDDKFAKCITKIFSRLFFSYTTTLNNRGSFPIHIIVEEAHRYVINDDDERIIGYNIFNRITKEGRKYGTILGFITQRPNELSKTALSQCANFIIFKMFYPEDLNIVRGISSNVTEDTIEKIKTLHPGMSLIFGTAFKVPILVEFDLPNPLPISDSLNIDKIWYE